jgi:uridine phosphorylase
MNSREFPIFEHDENEQAIIEPSKIIKKIDAPKICLIPFYHDVIERLGKKGVLKEIAKIPSSVIPPIKLYEMEYKGTRIGVLGSSLGAPFSSGNLEIAIALGCEKFLAIGSCGVLDKKFKRGHLIVVESSIREEGTSYHYIPPSREISVEEQIINRIQQSLRNRKIKYIAGKNVTTDAFFRETIPRINNWKKEGAISIDMEASALLAVAKFRKVQLGYILIAGDDVSGVKWNRRMMSIPFSKPESFFWLAADVLTDIYK